MTHGEVDRDGAAHGGAGKRHLAGDAERIQQCRKVIGHVVEVTLPPIFSDMPGAARVVAQHVARVVQRRHHLVPTVQRAAHFVHQHQRGLARARDVRSAGRCRSLRSSSSHFLLGARMPHCADGGHGMMKLHWSPRSPYVRKVMVVAHELGLADRIETVRTVVGGTKPHLELMRENPLGKIPTLVLEDGTILYNSPVICEYLDTLHGGREAVPRGRRSTGRHCGGWHWAMACWMSRWPGLASGFARQSGKASRTWRCGKPSCAPASMRWSMKQPGGAHHHRPHRDRRSRCRIWISASASSGGARGIRSLQRGTRGFDARPSVLANPPVDDR